MMLMSLYYLKDGYRHDQREVNAFKGAVCQGNGEYK